MNIIEKICIYLNHGHNAVDRHGHFQLPDDVLITAVEHFINTGEDLLPEYDAIVMMCEVVERELKNIDEYEEKKLKLKRKPKFHCCLSKKDYLFYKKIKDGKSIWGDVFSNEEKENIEKYWDFCIKEKLFE